MHIGSGHEAGPPALHARAAVSAARGSMLAHASRGVNAQTTHAVRACILPAPPTQPKAQCRPRGVCELTLRNLNARMLPPSQYEATAHTGDRRVLRTASGPHGARTRILSDRQRHRKAPRAFAPQQCRPELSTILTAIPTGPAARILEGVSWRNLCKRCSRKSQRT